MIKGINKRIVEITNTQNDYFEKAVLYIRPDRNCLSDTRLELEAKSYINSIAPPPDEIPQKEKSNIVIKLVCFAVALIAVAGISFAIAMYC